MFFLFIKKQIMVKVQPYGEKDEKKPSPWHRF